jgi:hypothetical protein
VSLLLERGADGTLVDDTGVTAFYSAFPLRHSYVIKSFLDAGAPGINVGNANGETVLQWAAMYGFPQLTERLLNHSANVNQVDDKGMSALHWAAAAGHDDVLRVLFDRGADLLAADAHGRSLLHHGAHRRQPARDSDGAEQGCQYQHRTAADSQLTVLHLGVRSRAARPRRRADLVWRRRDASRRHRPHSAAPLRESGQRVRRRRARQRRRRRRRARQREPDAGRPHEAVARSDERKQKKDRATFPERKRRIADLLAGKVDVHPRLQKTSSEACCCVLLARFDSIFSVESDRAKLRAHALYKAREVVVGVEVGEHRVEIGQPRLALDELVLVAAVDKDGENELTVVVGRVDVGEHKAQAVVLDALKVERQILAVKIATKRQLVGFVLLLFVDLVEQSLLLLDLLLLQRQRLARRGELLRHFRLQLLFQFKQFLGRCIQIRLFQSQFCATRTNAQTSR